jgi:CRP/FNR family cyclic AMP-dependent transcriptional regulator
MVMASRVGVPADVAESMSGTPILASTAKRDIRELAERGVLRQYRRGTYIFHQGDQAPEIHFLWRGRIEISSDSLTGHRQLHTTLEPPQFFGELGVLSQGRRTATAMALEDSAVMAIEGEVWLEFLAEHPDATLALLQALARQIAAHEAFVEDLLFLDLKGRVAKRLLQLVAPSLDELPDDGAVVPAVVTHADLASLSGGSRENVTRILSEFQRRGLVTRDDKRYVLKSINGLRKLAGL